MNTALLRRIKKHVLEEPKRLDMGCFLMREEQNKNYYDYPACKTVGCIAGWACVLSKENLLSAGEIEARATELLDITQEQANRLFYSAMDEKPQSRKMAKAVGILIDHFIATKGAE